MTKGKGIILGLLVLFSALFLTGIASAKQWANTYGGAGIDYASSIQQTSDGGYIVAGSTYGPYISDAWVLKLDSSGNVTWQKAYGGAGDDYVHSIQQTSDGGYIVAGGTGSFGAGYAAYGNAWVLKLDSSGNVTWQKTYGGAGSDSAGSIQQTSDGGYIVAGFTTSFGTGSGWVLKLDSSGNVIWQKTYGGAIDYARSIQQTSDEGYIVAGETYSFSAGYHDFGVLKLDSSGNVIWQKKYGGAGIDYANSIQQTSDGGYIVAGETSSFGAGYYDFGVLKLDSSGNVTWQKAYGGAGDDYVHSIQQTSDGGYIMAGKTNSFGAGYYDFWVLKLDSSGNVTWQKAYGGAGYENAGSIQQTFDGGYIVAGKTNSFGAGGYGYDSWVLKLDSSGNITDCPLIGTSSAAVNDTSVSVLDTSVTPYTSSATVNTTTVTPADSTVSLTQVCPIPTSALTVVKSGTGIGTVTSSPAGINCGTDCFEVYTFGTNVTLTATSNAHSTFGGWSGDCLSCGTNTTCSIIMNADKSCTAAFNQRKRMRH